MLARGWGGVARRQAAATHAAAAARPAAAVVGPLVPRCPPTSLPALCAPKRSPTASSGTLQPSPAAAPEKAWARPCWPPSAGWPMLRRCATGPASPPRLSRSLLPDQLWCSADAAGQWRGHRLPRLPARLAPCLGCHLMPFAAHPAGHLAAILHAAPAVCSRSQRTRAVPVPALSSGLNQIPLLHLPAQRPLYAEASSDRMRAWYRRHGFSELMSWSLRKSAPRVIVMARPPRPTAAAADSKRGGSGKARERHSR